MTQSQLAAPTSRAATPARSPRHPAYAAPATPGDDVFALSPPDRRPLTGPTRTATLWDGHAWFELDPHTGRVLDHGFIS